MSSSLVDMLSGWYRMLLKLNPQGYSQLDI